MDEARLTGTPEPEQDESAQGEVETAEETQAVLTQSEMGHQEEEKSEESSNAFAPKDDPSRLTVTEKVSNSNLSTKNNEFVIFDEKMRENNQNLDANLCSIFQILLIKI